MYVRTDGWTKYPLHFTEHRPFGAAAQKEKMEKRKKKKKKREKGKKKKKEGRHLKFEGPLEPIDPGLLELIEISIDESYNFGSA